MSAEEDAAGVTATSFVRPPETPNASSCLTTQSTSTRRLPRLRQVQRRRRRRGAARGRTAARSSARTEKSSGKGKTQDKELKKLALVTESSGKDVFSLQPVHDGSLASLHRVQRLLAVVKRFMADLQSQGRSADEKSKTPPATPGGAAGLTSMDAMAKAYGTPALRKRASRETAAACTRPPDPAAVSKVYAVLAELCCVATQVKFVPGMDAFKIDEMPKKRAQVWLAATVTTADCTTATATSPPPALPAQNLLRSQLAIEYIVKLVEFVWVRYFKDAELVKQSRDAAQWHGKWAPINRMCQLAHNLLRLLVVGNRRCADTLQRSTLWRCCSSSCPRGGTLR